MTERVIDEPRLLVSYVFRYPLSPWQSCKRRSRACVLTGLKYFLNFLHPTTYQVVPGSMFWTLPSTHALLFPSYPVRLT